jgi:hypothetical protein
MTNRSSRSSRHVFAMNIYLQFYTLRKIYWEYSEKMQMITTIRYEINYKG